MKRLHNWQSRLAAYIAGRERQPFAWGQNDCVTFAAGAVQVITGQALDLPAWECRRSAVLALRSLGGLRAAAIGVLGQPVDSRRAASGDIVYINRALLVCCGQYSVGPGPGGLTRVATRHARCAFKV